MKISTFNIASPRLYLRTYALADAKSLFQLVDENKKMLSDYFPMTVEGNTSVMAKRKYILERNADRKSGKHLFAGIFTLDKKLIGQILAKDINWRVPKCELGYFLDKDFIGKGLGSEAVNLFSTYCFEELGIAKITLRIEPSNIASKKLLEKAGFLREAYFKENYFFNGRFIDTEIYSLLNNE